MSLSSKSDLTMDHGGNNEFWASQNKDTISNIHIL